MRRCLTPRGRIIAQSGSSRLRCCPTYPAPTCCARCASRSPTG
jgi:hypothetical protein